MQKVNPDLGTEAFGNPMALVWAQLLYPFYGIQVTLVDTEDHGFTSLPVDRTATFVLMINSKHDNQRLEARKELKSLLQSLNISTPDLTNQPEQVEAATYVRLLQQHSWYGWLFTEKPDKLDLLKVDAERGVSKHHHKKFINHSFSPLNEQVDRDDAIKRDFIPESSWWYLKSLHPKVIQDFPNNFLLWKDGNGEDRGDVTDINLLTDSLGITNKKLLLAVFYQIKFEMADVLCFDQFDFLPLFPDLSCRQSSRGMERKISGTPLSPRESVLFRADPVQTEHDKQDHVADQRDSGACDLYVHCRADSCGLGFRVSGCALDVRYTDFFTLQ